jgi:putative transposase
MVKNPYLARSISDAGWAKFVDMLSYKAEKAGGQLIKVNPKNTSQACSGCGVIVKKDLSQRVHDCPDCGLVLDRDHNAAVNILRAGVAARGALNVGQWPERAPGKLMEIVK